MARSAIVAFLLALCSFPAQSWAVDLLYVSIDDNTVVTYDISKNSASEIVSSKNIFINNVVAGTIRFNSRGTFYACDPTNSTVRRYDSNGNYQGNFGLSSNMLSTSSLAFDANENIFVASWSRNKIYKFDSSGQELSNFSAAHPEDIVFNSQGQLYAVSAGTDNRIYVYNTDGTLVNEILGNSQTYLFQNITIDSTGNIYTTDSQINAIVKFDSNGNFLTKFGNSTVLDFPEAIVIDTNGNIFVSNRLSKSISKFDASGNFLFSWSTVGQPRSLTFAPNVVPEPSTIISGLISLTVIVGICKRRSGNNEC